MVAGVLPLHLFIRGEIIKANLRLGICMDRSWPGLQCRAEGRQKGHVRFSDNILANFGMGDFRKDFFQPISNDNRHFKVLSPLLSKVAVYLIINLVSRSILMVVGPTIKSVRVFAYIPM